MNKINRITAALRLSQAVDSVIGKSKRNDSIIWPRQKKSDSQALRKYQWVDGLAPIREAIEKSTLRTARTAPPSNLPRQSGDNIDPLLARADALGWRGYEIAEHPGWYHIEFNSMQWIDMTAEPFGEIMSKAERHSKGDYFELINKLI